MVFNDDWKAAQYEDKDGEMVYFMIFTSIFTVRGISDSDLWCH